MNYVKKCSYYLTIARKWIIPIISLNKTQSLKFLKTCSFLFLLISLNYLGVENIL